jgi:competence/damage-inducible protein CinA-like protein
MRAEIVGVGTELLLGQIANENARWMSERLAGIGVDVVHHHVVGDNLERIVDAFAEASARADAVLVTGGLGPTQDDVTRDALAAFLGVPMVVRSEIEDLLRAKFAGSARPMSSNNLRQAEVPQGCRYVTPVRGTAPGLVAELPDGVRLYLMPGVPLEMIEMMEGTVLPELASLAGTSAIVSRVVRCTGIGESRVAEVLDDLFRSLTNPTVAYLASSGETKVRLTAKAATREQATDILEPIVNEVAGRLGDDVFSTADESLEEVVLRRLRERGLRLACAESLTGGGVGERLTVPAGASEVFAGTAVVYTAEAKRAVLGVSSSTLEGPGPVSEACAREMAEGARRLYAADVALSLTGAAGPQAHGGTPPGTVWLGLDAEDRRHVRGYVSAGERDQVRRWAEQAGLDLVRRYLEGRALPGSDPLV